MLDKASLYFSAGGLFFVVGKSGSGKSTLGNLLVKFYEPLSGGIFIDGQGLPTLDDAWVRNNITLVQQGSVLFDDTLFMNIALGDPSPDKTIHDRVITACDLSLLHSTVASLPQGLQTRVGPHGHDLSGGQKQRVALARARLRDTPVLILDEVTSALDPLGRNLLMEEIRQWRRGKTTIIITHEVAQIKDTDFVYVMDSGRVVQRGLRKELSNDDSGMFAHLVASSPTQEETRVDKLFDDDVEKATGIGARINAIINFSRPLTAKSQSTLRLSSPGITSEPCGSTASAGIETLYVEQRRTSSQQHLLPPSVDRDATTPGLAWRLRQVFGKVAKWTPRAKKKTRDEISATSSDSSLSEPNGYGGCTEKFDSGMGGQSVADDMPGPYDNTIMRGGSSGEDGELQDTSSISLVTIYRTIWPCLPCKERICLIIGFFMCLLVAASVPTFSIVFANLLAVMYQSEDRIASGQKWSLYLLLIATIGSLATFLGHYLLNWAGQTWVNGLRRRAYTRVLRQPKRWFDNPDHSPSRIAASMDRNAEEVQNLVGRFAPLLLVVSLVVTSSVLWALCLSWKLALVSLASAPCLTIATRGYAIAAQRWESRCEKAAEDTGALAAEACSNVRIVRALGLEGFMETRHASSAAAVFGIGIRRAF